MEGAREREKERTDSSERRLVQLDFVYRLREMLCQCQEEESRGKERRGEGREGKEERML